MNDRNVYKTPPPTTKKIYWEEGLINKYRSCVQLVLSSSGESTILLVLSAFFFALFLSLLFSLTTGLSRVTILATASCTVGSNVYDADFVLATIWLISFAQALIVKNNNNIDNNNNNNNKNKTESNKIYNDDNNMLIMPTIKVMMMMMMMMIMMS